MSKPSAATTQPGAAALGAGHDEEGDDAARTAGGVTEVEVVRAGIVEVHGPLHQPKAEGAGVEVDRALGVAGYQGDVVQSLDHAWPPCVGVRPAAQRRCGDWSKR